MCGVSHPDRGLSNFAKGKTGSEVFHRERRAFNQHSVCCPIFERWGYNDHAKRTAPAGRGCYVRLDALSIHCGTLCRLEELCSSCFVKTIKIFVSAGTETTTLLLELRFMISVSPAVPIFSATR